jgi:hypothetical protein
MNLNEMLELNDFEIAQLLEAMTGPDFYNQLVSPEFKSRDTFPVKLGFNVDNKSVEVVIPIKLEMGNLKKEVDDYLKAPPELKQKLDTYAYWYDNFNKLIFENMGETDACLFLAACAYCSANTALDQNILEAAKLYKAVTEDSKTPEGIAMLGQLSSNVKNNMDTKSLEYLKTFQDKGSSYADLLVPKKDYKGGKVSQGARKGQDDVFSEITVANAKIPNFNLFVKYYLANRTKINKEQLYKDLQSGVLKIGGTKINSFFLNLVFPGKKWEEQIDPATVDRWMIRVFFDKPLQRMVEEDVSDWIQYLSSEDDGEEIGEVAGKPKKPKKPKLSPAEAAVAKKIAQLKKKQDGIVNKIVMKLFGDDVVRQNLVKILHEEAQKVGLTSYQLQALAWVNIRIRYDEPAAKFAKFEDVMAYAQDAAKNIMSINPDTNSVMNTIKILSSGPRFKFKDPQTVVDTIENAGKYEKVYFLPPKIKKPAKNKGPEIDYTKMKVALINDTSADIYDLSVSKKKPVHTIQSTDRKSTLSQSLKWILSYNPTPQAAPAVK